MPDLYAELLAEVRAEREAQRRAARVDMVDRSTPEQDTTAIVKKLCARVEALEARDRELRTRWSWRFEQIEAWLRRAR